MYMRVPPLSSLAVPGVLALVSFLAFTSQLLFLHIEPHPLYSQQALGFNALIVCLLVSYARACTTSPGYVPQQWSQQTAVVFENPSNIPSKKRWCRKCENYKPPRAHHCKVCQA